MFERRQKSFPEMEREYVALWRSEELFARSLQARADGPKFSFLDGPPFATGLPHYGHLLAGTIKDVIPRYKTMKGFYCERRFGWDCHGLPIENEVEKSLGLSGKASIEAMGIDRFNETCRSIVLRYADQWQSVVERMGRWVDFENGYRTMDLDFMESVWWVFSVLWEKGLVYEGFKVMPFSAKLGTPLSNFEANLNYKMVDDPSIVVTFPFIEEPQTSLLVWTTTPWTLPANLALAVNPDLIYVKINDREGRCFILAQERLECYFKLDEVEVVDSFRGVELKSKRYRPPFDYGHKQGFVEPSFTILVDPIAGEEGSGIVHLAPAFGEEDFLVCQRHGIEPFCPVDQNGCFTQEVPDYAGCFVKEADSSIIRYLKQEGRLFVHSQIHHRYPYCYRSETPLIYKAVSTWFIHVEALKAGLIEANSQIDWVPAHIQTKRFGLWLEGLRDWAVSRSRYFGTPMPIWRSPSGKCIVLKSREELERRCGQQIEDLHRHHIDQLTFSEGGELYRRIDDVFDCWFESGAMPYAQRHYPFESGDDPPPVPADFVAEGLDQTRGWFYTLHVLAWALFQTPAFKHVIVNGIVLAEDGVKMSKKLNNYPEPTALIEKHGADALRLYLLSSPAVAADDLRFCERGVELTVRQVLLPFWNAYCFLATYATIYAFEGRVLRAAPQAAIDRWIISRFHRLIEEVEDALEHYQLARAVGLILPFIEELTNWYIRRSRPRFWSDEATTDRREAFETLYTVLLGLSQLTAPLIPFLSEEIFRQLRLDSMPTSVHLCDFPQYEAVYRDLELEQEVAGGRRVVSMGHALRKEQKLKVRQPLAKLLLITSDPTILKHVERQREVILEELNVKQIEVSSDEDEFVTFCVKPNFRVLGKRVGSRMPELKQALSELDLPTVNKLRAGEQVEVATILLSQEDLLFHREVRPGLVAMTDDRLTLVFDITLTDELLQEGLARELINKINMQRRLEKLDVTDRIELTLDPTEKMRAAFEVHGSLICHETLITTISFEANRGEEWEINGEKVHICITKARQS